MKKFLRFLFNFFWVILVGITNVLTEIIMGISLCLTIIFIPFGLQHFKFIPLVFAPAGKVVATKYSRHPVMNTLWLIFGGFVRSVSFWLSGVLFAMSIIGIPIAKQIFKIASITWAPFGAEIVHDGEYTSARNFPYDIRLLHRRIVADPSKAQALILSKGIELKQLNDQKIQRRNRARKIFPLFFLASLPIAFLFVLAVYRIGKSPTIVFNFMLTVIAFYFIIIKITKRVVRRKEKKDDYHFSLIHFSTLLDCYPKGSPIAKNKQSTLQDVANSVSLPWRLPKWKPCSLKLKK